jgi:hypothetical protein
MIYFKRKLISLIKVYGYSLIFLAIIFNPVLINFILSKNYSYQLIFLIEIIFLVIGLFILIESKIILKIFDKTIFKINVGFALFYLIFIVFFLIGSLFIFESYFQISNDLPFKGKINGIKYTWGHKVIRNEFGFREKNFSLNKSSDTFRIMVLGDSLTWGAGLSVYQRYSYILQYLLNNTCQQNVEVLNFGFAGGPTVKERDLLIKYQKSVNPDLIVIGYYINDPKQTSEIVTEEKQRYDSFFNVLAKLDEFGFKFTSEFFQKKFNNIFLSLNLYPDVIEAVNQSYDINSNDWKDFIMALDEIKTISDDLHLLPPVFISLNSARVNKPINFNDNSDKLLNITLDWYHQAEKVAMELNYVTLNVEEELMIEMVNENMCVNKKDCHPNQKLNEIYARKLFTEIYPLIKNNCNN